MKNKNTYQKFLIFNLGDPVSKTAKRFDTKKIVPQYEALYHKALEKITIKTGT